MSVANLETFGTAGKEGTLYPDRETVLFQREGAGCLTHMWFGGDWPGYDRTRIRFYVDGEAKASIDMELFLGHGIGWGDASAPWGSARLGKTGHPSGLYNTYRIPFGKGVRVTGQLGVGVEKPQVFWWIIRGVENLPVSSGIFACRRTRDYASKCGRMWNSSPFRGSKFAKPLGPGRFTR